MKKELIFCLCLCSAMAKELEFIKFEGNKSFSNSVLQGTLGIEQPPAYLFWKKRKKYDSTEATTYVQTIKDFYESKGYYKCEVESWEQNGTLVFKIDENERIKVTSLKIESSQNLKGLVALKEGDFFDTDKFKESKENINRFLGNSGYPTAKLKAAGLINLLKYSCDVEFSVTNLKRSKFGDINITKLDDIDEDAIKERLKFKSGWRYDSRLIEESYENLYLTGAFNTVRIIPQINDETNESVPIQVYLEPGKTKSFKAAAGYDSDEGARLKLGWQHKNFMGNLKRLESELELSQKKQILSTKLFLPQLMYFTFEDEFALQKIKNPGYYENKVSNTAKLGKDLLATQHHFGVMTESGYVKVTDNSTPYIQNENFFINSLIYDYTLDKRDSKIDAKSGHFVNFTAELAEPLIGSSISYLKMFMQGRKIFSFAQNGPLKDFVLATKADIGMIDDYRKNQIPVFKRFYAGGSFSNRGYNYQQLGQKDGYNNPIGGASLLDMSAEARYKALQDFWGVLFFDTTLLNIKSLSYAGEYRHSVGIGGRYVTIVGPMRFDIGVPLREQHKNPVFHVSFGQVY